jgi:hypothetical protein
MSLSVLVICKSQIALSGGGSILNYFQKFPKFLSGILFSWPFSDANSKSHFTASNNVLNHKG